MFRYFFIIKKKKERKKKQRAESDLNIINNLINYLRSFFLLSTILIELETKTKNKKKSTK